MKTRQAPGFEARSLCNALSYHATCGSLRQPQAADGKCRQLLLPPSRRFARQRGNWTPASVTASHAAREAGRGTDPVGTLDGERFKFESGPLLGEVPKDGKQEAPGGQSQPLPSPAATSCIEER